MFQALAGVLKAASTQIGKSFNTGMNIAKNKFSMLQSPEKFGKYLASPERKSSTALTQAQNIPIENMQIISAPDAGSLLSQLAQYNNQ